MADHDPVVPIEETQGVPLRKLRQKKKPAKRVGHVWIRQGACWVLYKLKDYK